MSKIITEVDVATGIVTEREMTAEEIAEIEELYQSTVDWNQQLEAKAAARESALAKLAELGLTAEEIAAL